MANRAGVTTPKEAFPLAHVGEEADAPGPIDSSRADAGGRLALSLAQLLREVDARWPGRDRKSDLAAPDPPLRKGDHVQNDRGVVRALDIDAGGIRADLLAEYLRRLAENGDPRLVNGGYVVFNHRIASEIGDWHWRVYTGENPHTSHVHVSVSLDPAGYDAGDGWAIADVVEPAPPVPTLPPVPAEPPGTEPGAPPYLPPFWSCRPCRHRRLTGLVQRRPPLRRRPLSLRRRPLLLRRRPLPLRRPPRSTAVSTCCGSAATTR